MRIYTITFSPTGGTKKVADIVAGEFAERTDVDLLKMDNDYGNYKFTPEDICFLAVPSFGGRVPKTAVHRIENMKGNGARCILICVYGNRAYEDTLLELKNTAKKAGFLPVAAVAAVAEHSIMHQFAAGRPDAADQEHLKKFSKELHEKLGDTDFTAEVTVPGNEVYRDFGGVPFVPKANRNCTACGKCARECPVGAIDPQEPKKTDKEKCISCMRCIAVCPAQARKLNGVALKVAAGKMAKACEGRKENELFLG